MCSSVDDFNNRNSFLTAKLLKQGYRYKFRKAFSKFYHRHSELIVKYNIRLKTLLQQGVSEPIFYGHCYKYTNGSLTKVRSALCAASQTKPVTWRGAH